MDVSESDDTNIENLSKQLLQLSSPFGRRRSSAPSLDEGLSTSFATPRRHSMNQEKRPESPPEDNLAGNTVGQLVDRIREVEPCIVKSALDTQVQLDEASLNFCEQDIGEFSVSL